MAVLPPDPIFNIRSSEMGPVHSLCFHQDERLLAGTEKGTVHLWDLQTNRSPLHFAVGTDPIMALHHTEDTLITQEKGGTVKLWNMSNSGYDLQTSICTAHSAFCRTELIPSHGLLAVPKNENEISLISLDSTKELFRLTSSAQSPLGLVSCLKAVDINGQTYILSGFESGMLVTWDLRICKAINQEQLLDECAMAVDYDPFSNRGVCAGSGNKISVFTYQRQSIELTKMLDITIKNSGINCLRIRSDQKVFASAGWDGRIRIFSWKSLRPLAVLTEHKNGGVVDIAYSSGKVTIWNAPIMAACGMDGQITLWDLYN